MVKKYRHDFNFILGLCLVALVMIPVFIGLFYTPYEPSAMNMMEKSCAPSAQHWFGTDYFGRDIFSRVLEGAKMTFLVGALTIFIGAGVGIFFGALTGYFGGPLDDILMRINDGLASFPSVLLALVLVSIFGSGKYMIVLTLGIVFIPSFARVARGEFIAQKEMDYVKNAKLMGASDLRIMFVHILPNTKAILLSAVTIGFNNAVLAEAGLSYLSIGAQPTDVSLGRMLAEAQGYLMTAPWFALAPGLIIVITILGFSLMSEALGKSGDRVGKSNSTKKRRSEQKNKIIAPIVKNRKEKEKPLLRVQNMTIGFYEKNEWDYVVEDVTFSLNKGEVLGIVGESGSGKSMTALGIMGLLKSHGRITDGSVVFDGKELTKLTPQEYEKMRGFEMSMVFQEPMTSLNPVMTVGKQVEELLHIHGLETVKKRTEELHGREFRMACKERTLAALREAGLKNPADIYGKYPHELSGGMRQRVMIAMAMICGPKLLIADEPTTALDVTIQAKILRLLKEMNQKHGTAIIFISHDLNIIRKMCDRVVVMYQGKIVEQGTITQVFKEPKQAYTKKLLQAAIGEQSMKPLRESSCLTPKNDETTELGKRTAGHPHMIELKKLSVFYAEKSKKLFRQPTRKQVVKDVSLHIREGEILGVVGESGCGKSSMAKAIVGLQQYTSGEILLETAHPQMVFQDPYGSLNPAKRVGWLLEEPLRLNTDLSDEERVKKVDEILTRVDLPLRYKSRFPSELSGGQRQRVAIALSLILNQKLIILDEPVSALDVTVQEQILTLLLRLREEFDLSYMFISHDMQVIRRVCDYVCVMYQGEIVENAKTEELFENPKHEYTKKLLKAAE